MFEKVFLSLILFSVTAGCFMTMVEAQESGDEPRPRHVVEDTNCKYSFSPNGQCYIEYEGPKRPGVTSGSCLPLAYGGDCFNVPPECKTCQDIEIGDAIKNLARKKTMFLSKFLGVKF